MKYLVTFSIVVLLLTTPSCKWLREKGLIGKKKANSEAALKAQQDSLRVADSLRLVNERILALEQARADSIAAAELKLASEKYSIIVGSFVTPEYARNWETVYKAKGYNARIVKLEGTDFELVVAESHENINTAVQRLKHFQDNEVFDSWIYIRQ
jgi:cell division protein FtsN